MMTLLQAMARQEGFYAAGSRPQRNNNPGDLEYGKFAMAHGATSSDGRFAVFPTAAAGFKAMQSLLGGAYRGMTIEQALNRYAPPVENNTNRYLEDVLQWTGLQAGDVISDHLVTPEIG